MNYRFYSQTEAEKSALKYFLESSKEDSLSKDYKHTLNILMFCFPYSKVLSELILVANSTGNNDLPADAKMGDLSEGRVLNGGQSNSREMFINHARKKLEINIDSVIDVGCGNGDLLRSLIKSNGYTKLQGIEHPRYKFSPWHKNLPVTYEDLSHDKLDHNHRYDIAICNEVAEHINPKNVDIFLENLISLSDTIILGASLTRQPGDGHILCRPPSFWKKKFQELNYEQIDIFRELEESSTRSEVYDCFVYVNQETISKEPHIRKFSSQNCTIDAPSVGTLLEVSHTLNQIKNAFIELEGHEQKPSEKVIIESIKSLIFGPKAEILELLDMTSSSYDGQSKVYLPSDIRDIVRIYR